jgi:hypothetical protein
MNIMTINMKNIIVPIAAAAAFSISSLGFADNIVDDATANVVLQTALDVVETTQLDFGTVVNTDGSCTLSQAGALGGTCSGTGTAGVFTITGDNNALVGITTAFGTLEGGNIKFTPSAPATATIGSGGNIAVNVGGDLLLDGASSGTKAIPYTFTANYQ